ncbi:MAG: hypothetical protein ACRDJI_01555 [Actinomycetota bacterium]
MNDREFPGADVVAAGIADLERGVESIPALLVSIGYARLRKCGLQIPAPIHAPEKQLYLLLAERDPRRAHSEYNSWLRRLISFERAAECAG